jgi:hypothetical protein
LGSNLTYPKLKAQTITAMSVTRKIGKVRRSTASSSAPDRTSDSFTSPRIRMPVTTLGNPRPRLNVPAPGESTVSSIRTVRGKPGNKSRARASANPNNRIPAATCENFITFVEARERTHRYCSAKPASIAIHTQARPCSAPVA